MNENCTLKEIIEMDLKYIKKFCLNGDILNYIKFEYDDENKEYGTDGEWKIFGDYIEDYLWYDTDITLNPKFLKQYIIDYIENDLQIKK